MLFREKDNPERRFDYLDEIIGTIGKGTLGLTVNCARCHNHKFDPIAAKDYYSIQASLFGYVETEVPLAPRAEAEAYLAKNDEINGKLAALRSAITALEKPQRDRLELEQIRIKFPPHIYRAAAKAEKRADARRKTSRHPGLRSRERARRRRSRRSLSPADLAKKTGSASADRGARQAAPGAAADGRDRHRRRLPVLAARRGRRHHQLSQVQNPAAVSGQLRSHGRQVRSAAVILPGSRRPREPRLVDEARFHRRDHLRQSADRDSAAGRKHLGPPSRARAVDCVAAKPDDRARHRQSPVAKAFRARHRRHARELRQDGRAADASGVARLAGGGIHEPRLEHQADQQDDDDVGGVPDGVGLRARRQRRRATSRTGTCGDSGRSGSKPRSSATASSSPGATSISRSAASRSFRSSPPTSSSVSTAASGRTRPRVRRRGGAACTSIDDARCRIRCSIPSTIPT